MEIGQSAAPKAVPHLPLLQAQPRAKSKASTYIYIYICDLCRAFTTGKDISFLHYLLCLPASTTTAAMGPTRPMTTINHSKLRNSHYTTRKATSTIFHPTHRPLATTINRRLIRMATTTTSQLHHSDMLLVRSNRIQVHTPITRVTGPAVTKKSLLEVRNKLLLN